MENAADALKMAAAILIFVIAIASSFSLFGVAKKTSDSIISIRDRQSYLEAAELDGGILYTSSSAITGETGLEEDEIATKLGVTTKGDRIVGLEDVISTIYRYSKEKYGVTIVKKDGTVLGRYDSNTEQIMSNWYRIPNRNSQLKPYTEKLKENTNTGYTERAPEFNIYVLERLYKISVTDSPSIQVGAPWYGNEEEIQKRIACDLEGPSAEYTYNNQTYKGKDWIGELREDTKIVEVINEVDNSKYLIDESTETNLLQEYTIPTVEIVYIILD